MILNKAQVEQMDIEGVEQALKQFHKAYKVDKPMTPEMYAIADEVCNTLLYLEEHQSYLKASAMAIHANKMRWGDKDENESDPS